MAITLARLTTDRTTTTNVMIDCTNLGFSVAAGTNYAFRFVVHCLATSAATGVRFSINGPLVPVAIRFGGIIPISTVAANFGSVSTYDSPVFAATTSTTVAVMGIIEGVFQNGTNAGTLQLRFCGELTNATVTVQANSHGILIPI